MVILNGVANEPSGKKQWEILFIDDGATPSTIDAINSIMPGVVAQEDPFVVWANENSLADEAAAFHADPDNDGIGNGLEFFTGSDPNTAGSSPLSVVSADGNSIAVQYHRALGVEGVVAEVETSSDLTTWVPADDIVFAETDGPNEVIVLATITNTEQNQLFVRLKVSQTEE